MRMVAMTATLVLAMAGVARGEPVACQRAVAKAALAFTAATAKAFLACEEDKRLGKLPAGVDCATDDATVATVAAAEAKLRAAVPKACGGKNRICDPADAGPDADDALAAIGWDVSTCPSLGSASCGDPIADCDDVASCLACVGRAGVGETSALANGAFGASTPGEAVNRCQLAIGRETASYLVARAKALRKCHDLVLRGKTAGPCPAGDAKTQAMLARAEAKKVAKICKACGGSDGACGGPDDLTPAAIGFAASCPGVTPPGGSSCGGPIATLDDLVACVDCVAAFDADCLGAVAVPGVADYPAACAPAPTRTPTPTPTATPPAGPDAVKCERALVKESAKLVQARVRALAACEQGVLAGKLSAGTDCAADPATAERIAKAADRFMAQVAKACGGADRTCDPTDTGADAGPTLAEIGWGLPACPDFAASGCDGPLVDCADVSSCFSCIADVATVQAMRLSYAFTPAAPGSATARCQAAIGAGVVDFIAARGKALQKCADAQLRGRAAGPCPEPGDGKAAAAIAKAEDRLITAICKACGGADRLCGGGDDLVPAALGFPPVCPALGVAGGPACGGSVQTLADLVACLGCVVTFETDCTDRAAIPSLRGYPSECSGGVPVPTPTATPGGGGGTCGNGVVEAGEACDDGNTTSCDGCRGDCLARTAPIACASSTVRHAQRVRLQAPPETSLAGVIACIEYPVGTVALPGTGLVGGRVSNVSGLVTLNDFDDAVQISFVANPGAAEFNPTISFDLCSGQAAPAPEAFDCVVKDASSSGGTAVDPTTVVCTPVTIP